MKQHRNTPTETLYNIKTHKPKTGTNLANTKYKNNILQSFVNEGGFGFDYYIKENINPNGNGKESGTDNNERKNEEITDNKVDAKLTDEIDKLLNYYIKKINKSIIIKFILLGLNEGNNEDYENENYNNFHNNDDEDPYEEDENNENDNEPNEIETYHEKNMYDNGQNVNGKVDDDDYELMEKYNENEFKEIDKYNNEKLNDLNYIIKEKSNLDKKGFEKVDKNDFVMSKTHTKNLQKSVKDITNKNSKEFGRTAEGNFLLIEILSC